MYKRKTRDEWQLWINYGQGFEHETSEETFTDVKNQSKCYAENCPQYARKIKFKRVKIESGEF